MPDLIARIRSLVSAGDPPATPDHERIERELADRDLRLRLARIDAGLPVRRQQVYPHPNRRASDRT